jgi:hypothetical protein
MNRETWQFGFVKQQKWTNWDIRCSSPYRLKPPCKQKCSALQKKFTERKEAATTHHRLSI